jgi:hypothetical protein
MCQQWKGWSHAVSVWGSPLDSVWLMRHDPICE